MVEHSYEERGPPYVKWAAEMAVQLQTGVPWLMCNQDDAPDPLVSTQYGRRSMRAVKKFDAIEMWEEFKEPIINFEDTSLKSYSLLEHMSTTKDSSDYLWYTFSHQESSDTDQALLSVKSLGHVLHAFVNGVPAGSAHGSHKNKSFTLQSTVSLIKGVNNISLLSVMVGLPDSGAYLESRNAGLVRVLIQDKQRSKEFTSFTWGYQVGLVGEKLQMYNNQGSSQLQWSRFSSSREPLSWYKTVFDAPVGDDPVVLNLGSMGKGEAWVNGQSIGRYWVSFLTPKGSRSQTWYHVPRSFLKPTGNVLVILEEEGGGYPPSISIDSVVVKSICGQVTASHYNNYKRREAQVHLQCPPRKHITKILFASYGNPSGGCATQDYAFGTCHSFNSTSIVEKNGGQVADRLSLAKEGGGDGSTKEGNHGDLMGGNFGFRSFVEVVAGHQKSKLN
ncbi:hypothetical protein LWI29_035785 [Acer saccharum]|uniref:beta-galactosidase n=1 Tax=Acer saccharum TaxID=4024 RepID=A0AA39RP64_ACESA|nr:hypothetical protein LWI29_035785 [Acer saccharum]